MSTNCKKSNNDYIQGQYEVATSIRTIYDKFKRDGTEKKNHQYVQSRLTNLESLYADFQQRHHIIEHDEQSEYFIENVIGQVTNIYNTVKALLLERLAQLATANASKPLVIPPTSSNSSTGKGSQQVKDSQNHQDESQLPNRLTIPRIQMNQNEDDAVEQDRRIRRQLFRRDQIIRQIEASKDDQSTFVTTRREKMIHDLWDKFSAEHEVLISHDTDLNQDYFTLQIYEEVESIYLESTSHQQPASNHLNTNNQSYDIKLPRLSIPTFNGNYTAWTAFRDLFQEMIHSNPRLSDVQRLQYLKANLQGEAASIIKHFTINGNNYESAWQLLNARYENPRWLVNAQITLLMSQPILTSENLIGLKKLHDTSLMAINALKNLNLDLQSWDPILIYIIASKLDKESIRLHEQAIKDPKTLEKLDDFMQFLVSRFQTLETIKSNTQIHSATSSTPWRNSAKKAVVSNHSAVSKQCPVSACKLQHEIDECKHFLNQSISERWGSIKSYKLCVRCLRKHASSKPCGKRCKKCNKSHHITLHDSSKDPATVNQQNDPDNKEDTPAQVCTHANNFSTKENSVSNETLLATAIIKVKTAGGKITLLRALIDQGSQASIITEETAQLLGVKRKKHMIKIKGLGNDNAKSTNHMITIAAYPLHESEFKFNINALVMSKITSILPSSELQNGWKHIQNLKLADPQFHKPGKIDILLGADVYADIILNGVIKGEPGGPIAQHTELGWILSGKIKYSREKFNEINCMITQVDIDTQLKRFWEINEVLGEDNNHMTYEEKSCEENFERHTHRTNNGRYIVKLPTTNQILGQSRHIAIATLLQMEKRFARDAIYKGKYTEFINEYIALGHMRKVPANADQKMLSANYLPHHAVLKEDGSTTKIRVVFDASRKTSNQLSLNDVSLTGPKLQSDLMDIILRWRKHKYVFIADIEKMYRQIMVSDHDRDLQRVVWRSDDSKPIDNYQLLTVTYGTASAPYLAIKTLHKLARDYEDRYPVAANIALKDFYVDDVLSGADTVTTAIESRDQLIKLLNKGGFTLHKWASNNKRILGDITATTTSDAVSLDFDNSTSIKTLGIRWKPQKDEFEFKITFKPATKALTKRRFLSEVSSLFDPLGWLAPCIIKAKILLQHLWTVGVGWDEKVPENIAETWATIRDQFQVIKDVNIPRWIKYTTGDKIEYHGFCDASEAAYAAVIYSKITQPDGTILITLIAAKTKVAPIKKVSIPRLELNGALMLAKLMKRIAKIIAINDAEQYLWCDSQVTLSWIKGHPHKWKTYVANRVAEIQTITQPLNWRYIKSNDNPADCASRGMYPSDILKHSLWWNGPEWLTKPTEELTPEPVKTPKVIEEERKISCLVSTGSDKNHLELLNRFSKFSKLRRVTAYICRFFNNARTTKAKRIYNALSVKELNDATELWIKLVQKYEFEAEYIQLSSNKAISHKSNTFSLNPFMDTNQIIRVGGRLKNSTLSEDVKHPIILPKNSQLSLLIINHAHERTLHGGVQQTVNLIRKKYWIINGRNAVRQQIHKCISCHRQRATTGQQLFGNLPAPRITISRPFSSVGIDYAGPIDVRVSKGRGNKSYKGYIAIFVCLATKAIHIEVVSDATSMAFIAAFKRFVSRRGLCKNVYSDNGTNFVGADKTLRKQLQLAEKECGELVANEGIQFHFIPPAASHFGGIWEAAVKSMKHHLKRVIGQTTLTYEELSTVLHQIEACLNSRPLCALTDDPDDIEALTPGHFLMGTAPIAVPDENLLDKNVNTLTRWRLLENLQQHFWKRWSNEYLTTLQQRPKWTNVTENVQPGMLALIKDERLPPTKWQLGKITKTSPGTDKLTRVMELKTQNGLMTRPLTKICILPTIDNEELKMLHNAKRMEKQDSTQPDAGTSHKTIPSDSKNKRITKNSNKCLPLALTVLLCITSVFGQQTPYKLQPFDQSPGIYYQDNGIVKLINGHWNIIAYYDLENYWAELGNLKTSIHKLSRICTKSFCKSTMSQFNHSLSDIQANNELIFGKKNLRKKRGALDFIGNLAGDIFGVLDSRFAEKYKNDIFQSKANEAHLLHLLRNQTTISEVTENIMRKTNQDIQNQFSFINEKTEQILNLTDENQKDQEIQNIIIQCSMIANTYRDTQRMILNTILDTHQGNHNPSIISPTQLQKQLEIIKTKLPATTTTPDGIENNINKIYKLMKIKAAVLKNHIIFNVAVPLVNTEHFQLYKITAVPIAKNENYIWITPSTQYIIINPMRDLFYPLDQYELDKCAKESEAEYWCEQYHPIYNPKSTFSHCEIALMLHSEQLSPTCKMETKVAEKIWIPLTNTNEWIYALPTLQIIDIICQNRVFNVKLEGMGIIKLQPGCTIKQPTMLITAFNGIQTRLNSSFVPLTNISMQLPELTPIRDTNKSLPVDTSTKDEYKKLSNLIRQQKDDETLPTAINSHDIHHYTMLYSLLIVAIILLVIKYYKKWRNGSENSRTSQSTPNEDIQPDAEMAIRNKSSTQTEQKKLKIPDLRI